ncbi:AMP-binding protein [Streptomyces sp. M19]
MHQALLGVAARHTETLARAELRFVRSASAPLPGPVLTALEDAFGAPVIEAYGMTEAGSWSPATRCRPAAASHGRSGAGGRPGRHPGPGRAAAGPRRVREIAIRGENVMAGYEHHPEANRLAFTDGWFRTGDEGGSTRTATCTSSAAARRSSTAAAPRSRPWRSTTCSPVTPRSGRRWPSACRTPPSARTWRSR